MKVMALKMSQLSFVNEGSYGSYYRIKGKRLGIKILNTWEYGYVAGDGDSESAIKNSSMWDSTKEEFEKLRKARRMTRSVPKPVGLAIIKEYNSNEKRYHFSCGYIMQHVYGDLLDNSDYDYKKLDRLQARLEKRGFEMSDNHGENIMVHKNKFFFIDAGRFSFKKKRKKKK